MTVGELLDEAARALAAAGVEGSRLDARVLLGHVLGEDPARLAVDPRREVGEADADRFRALAARRASREPAAFLTGRREFWSLDFEVSAATLIPRPDTETVVEAALAAIEDRPRPRILDLGTGTGAILIALLAERPDAEGVGVDLTPEAVALARRNAARLGVGARARFGVSSWWSHVPPGDYDLVVSNPPYVESATLAALEPEVRDHEPATALDGGADGLAAYRAIAAGLAPRLASHGAAVLEIGRGQGEAVRAIFAAFGFACAAGRADLGDVERALTFARAGERSPKLGFE